MSKAVGGGGGGGGALSSEGSGISSTYLSASGRFHPGLASSLNNLANLLHLDKQYDEAEALYRQALQLYLLVKGTARLGHYSCTCCLD